MKLAEKILNSVKKPVDESMGSSDRINVDLGDGHSVGISYSCEIYQRRHHSTEPEGFVVVDDVEKQAAIKALIKADADIFMKSVAMKLKTLQK